MKNTIRPATSAWPRKNLFTANPFIAGRTVPESGRHAETASMKKKIIFRIPNMEMGGVQKVMLDVIEHLDPSYFEPFILLDICQGALLRDIPPSVTVFSLAGGREDMSSLKAVRFCQLMARRLNLMRYRYFPGLLRKKLGFVPDIEVAMMNPSVEGMLASPFSTSKKINWFHSDIRHWKLAYGKRMAVMMNRCDSTIFVSQATEDHFRSHLSMEIRNSICIYNTFDEAGVQRKAAESVRDAGERDILKQSPLFVSVGRLCHQKGYDILAEAHRELLDEGFSHTIAIVGGGVDAVKLEQIIRSLQIGGSFFLLGPKHNPHPYILAAGYYIQPSRYEAYPLSVGEALILNRPVICTDVGGVRELLVHERTGYLADPSKEGLKEAMRRFMTDPELVAQIREGQKALNFPQHNTRIYRQINQHFREISDPACETTDCLKLKTNLS